MDKSYWPFTRYYEPDYWPYAFRQVLYLSDFPLIGGC